MAVCFSCEKEIEGCLCDSCRQTVDVEDLCNRVIKYKPNLLDNPDSTPIWKSRF